MERTGSGLRDSQPGQPSTPPMSAANSRQYASRQDRRELDAARTTPFLRIPHVVSGAPVEENARVAGHANSRTTEVVYRRELRPVLTTCAEARDRIFAAQPS